MESKTFLRRVEECLENQDFHAALKIVSEVEDDPLETLKLYIMIYQALVKEMEDDSLPELVKANYEQLRNNLRREIYALLWHNFDGKKCKGLESIWKDIEEMFAEVRDSIDVELGKERLETTFSDVLKKVGDFFINISKEMTGEGEPSEDDEEKEDEE